MVEVFICLLLSIIAFMIILLSGISKIQYFNKRQYILWVINLMLFVMLILLLFVEFVIYLR
jgi:hypothetical protein